MKSIFLREDLSGLTYASNSNKQATKNNFLSELNLSKENQDRINTFAATLGLGPKYKAKKKKTYKCPKCGSDRAFYREVGADTDYNCMELKCPDCNYSEEK
jgi:DNA-directed RNA polymerase subunit M/transcription elongation factor TFIIS